MRQLTHSTIGAEKHLRFAFMPHLCSEQLIGVYTVLSDETRLIAHYSYIYQGPFQVAYLQELCLIQLTLTVSGLKRYVSIQDARELATDSSTAAEISQPFKLAVPAEHDT
ncbi:hypothetical protein CHARACLAT_009056 [Characodon lateralis]|uniref:Uncharacterized protein n=1 Tax=Characodon lateralis TaxID=208331 RepID=A0ABU7CNT6_9TELE|nr:hypothetical protein [Characodon lateralis]